MNISKRIKKLEKTINLSSKLEDARAYVSLFLRYAEPGSIPPNFNVEEEAKRFAAEGVGLKKLLDSIAAKGQSPPMGSVNEQQ